jgi:hypothetical protein
MERTVQAFLERDLTDLMRSLHYREKPLSILRLQGVQDSVNQIDEGPELIRRRLPDTEIVVYKDGYHGEGAIQSQAKSGGKLTQECVPRSRGIP